MTTLAIKVDVTRDTATPSLAALREGIKPARLARPAGQAAVTLFKRHFGQLAAARHRPVAPTNFYAGAARATSYQPAADGVVVSVNHQGIAQRYFGGTIDAKPGSALTIPVNEKAYGRRARELSNLRLVLLGPRGHKTAVLAAIGGTAVLRGRTTATRRPRGSVRADRLDALTVMYVLVQSVTQKPDPSVLPTNAEIGAAVSTALGDYVQAIIDRRQAGGEA